MMTGMILAATVAGGLTTYPGFLAPGRTAGRPVARVEAIVDKGPVAELIVRCPRGTAIVSYSKIERLYCGPRGGCGRGLAAVVSEACR